MLKNHVARLLVVVAVAAFAMPLHGSDAATGTPAPAQASPSEAIPAEPEKAPGTETELPNLSIPEPNFVCLAGMCSSNTQCQQWHGSGWICSKKSGASCGYCIELQ